MLDFILLRAIHVLMWFPLVAAHLWLSWRARQADDAPWERHHIVVANIWMAVAIITGSLK